MTDQVDPQQDQLTALEAAQAQHLEALALQREWAMESAKYWEDANAAATADLPQAQTAALGVPPVSPTLLTTAHFDFLESVVKAQATFSRTLLTGSAG